MKRLILSFLTFAITTVVLFAQSLSQNDIILTPYLQNDANTPAANTILLDKLNRIVTKYGVCSSDGILSPFIITAHAIDIKKETTATVPPQTAVEISLTIYIGNGEDGTQFSSCNLLLKGVGSNLDKAYASAFKRINVNDPEIQAAVDSGKKRIIEYYSQAGVGLIKKAEAFAAAGNYADAYGVLLQIPPVCPQYSEAQDLLIALVEKESDASNSDIIAQARALWTSNPNQEGAAQASDMLNTMVNASPKLRNEANLLMKEMSSRIQKVEDSIRAEAEREAAAQRNLEANKEAHDHQRQMQAIKSATKVAVAQAQRPVYNIIWW